jgi:Mg2+ and Co2+ transporter CorA
MDTGLMEKIDQLKDDIFILEETIFEHSDSLDPKKLYTMKKQLIKLKIKNPDNKELNNMFDIFENLESTYERMQDEKMNKRLNILTIWSTLFLPLSFYTGLWGMNFTDIPFLNDKYGFWIFVTFTTVTCGGLWFYFKKKSWI